MKTEIEYLKQFINSKLKKDFDKGDYMVDITNCYILGINGKKYITLRKCNTIESGWDPQTGTIYFDDYQYYDVLNIKNHRYKFLHQYMCASAMITDDGKPDYEKHILEACPELSVFVDNKVPNTYLKKIYYEINELSDHKKLLKKMY